MFLCKAVTFWLDPGEGQPSEYSSSHEKGFVTLIPYGHKLGKTFLRG
jgi:hypothetical protein